MRLQEVFLIEDVDIDVGHLLAEIPWFHLGIDQAEAIPNQSGQEFP